MDKKIDVEYDFSDKTIKRRRTLPKGKIILLTILIILQVLCVLGIVLYRPKPQDIIDKYEIYVTPQDDGSLDIEYRLTWTPLDESEPLTFVYLGIANPDYTVLGHSTNITRVECYDDSDGECHVDLHFGKKLYKNDTIEFSVTINQKNMLCERDGEYFYEFVPGWFNSTPISSYTFHWKNDGSIKSSNSDYSVNGWQVWSGSMDAGEYRMMRASYSELDAPTVEYKPFYDGGVHNDLHSERVGFIVVFVVLIIVLFIFEIFCNKKC